MLADDNWGNLMAVLPKDRRAQGAGGIYYHADCALARYCVITAVSLTCRCRRSAIVQVAQHCVSRQEWAIVKTKLTEVWEQTHIAKTFDMTDIWIINIGDLKFLEMPLEYFMQLAYDSDHWPLGSTIDFLRSVAARDFGREHAAEIAEIMALYSIYASRRKAELLDTETYSLVNYDE